MDQLVFELVEALKNEPVYIDYLEAKQELEQDAKLIYEYKTKKEEYLKMEPLFKYQDFSELKQSVLDLADKVEHLSSYKHYSKARRALEIRLEEINHLIFNGVGE